MQIGPIWNAVRLTASSDSPHKSFGTRAVADDDLSLSCCPVQAQAEHCSVQADVAVCSMTRTPAQHQPQ